MSQTNGQVTAEAVQAVEQAVGKLRVDADLLTSKDMRRARAMLRKLHGDDAPDPYDVIGSKDFEDRITFIVWCLRSRTDPGFTWEQAEEIPYGELDLTVGEPPPPQGGQPEQPGLSTADAPASGSSRKPRAVTAAPRSVPSTH